jgi:hypothetical protein
MSESIFEVIKNIFGVTQDEVFGTEAEIDELEEEDQPEEVDEEAEIEEVEPNVEQPTDFHEMLGHASWNSFLTNFKSSHVYVQRVKDFLSWKSKFGEGTSLEANLITYFDYKNSEINEEGVRRFSASTMCTWFSIFVTFWKHTSRGNLKLLCPIIEDNLKKWGKTQVRDF